MTLVEPVRSAVVEMALTACRGDGTPQDVWVELPRDTRVGALAVALAHHVGIVDPHATTDLAIFCHRSGWLENDISIADANLLTGDRLEITAGRSFGRLPADRTDGARHGTVDLVVTGGPEAGRRIPLIPGRHVVGRGEDGDVTIADPSISRTHLVLEIRGARVTVTDLGSQNGTAVEGVALLPNMPRELRDGEQVELGRTLLTTAPHTDRTSDALAGPDATILFNRPPRVARPRDAPSFALSAPPSETQRTKIPMGAALLPLAMGIGFAVLVHQIAMLLFAVLSPAMIVWNAIADRRSGRTNFVKASKAFREEIARTTEHLAEAHRREVAERRRSAPDAGELASRALGRLPTLWERRRNDADFLSLRLGTADQPSVIAVTLPAGGSPELRAEAEPLTTGVTVPAVPALVELTEVGTLGIWGSRERGSLLARWLLIQVATLHSPRELLVGACLPAECEQEWSWLKWLPHREGEALGIDGPLLTVREADARGLLRELVGVVRERRDTINQRFGARTVDLGPAVVMLIDERVGLDRAQVATLLEDGPAAGVHVIWLGEHERELPGGLGALAELAGGVARLDLVDVASGSTLADVAAEGMDHELAEDVARALAPMRDIGATGTRSEIPKRVALPALLALTEATSDEIAARWSRSRGQLATPIGVAAGTPLTIDLRHDGPHALIAGTTGAGKSELLQSLVAGLAATAPPDRLTFLLIDYKGGAAFKEFADLPHAVGMVTDLDEHLAHRALISLNAELKRREGVLAAAGARDLLELEEQDPTQAPPSLAIVIDEFATLAKEVPAFVDGIVDVAQRGRSLGVHLVLATQRPGGVVSENIRANTNLRIALRVASEQDSEDVIGARDAGRIPRSLPGRALARTGHEELTTFQAAYAGGRSLDAGSEPRVTVRPFGFHPLTGGNDGGSPAGSDGGSDLRRLVTAIAEATRAAGIPTPAAPWLAPLTAIIELDGLEPAGASDPDAADASVICGTVDEPERQRQRPLRLDFDKAGSLLIYGASGAGKTTALRTIAAALALQAPPSHLRLYGLDCASRALSGIDALPHCGGVVTVEDEDRVRRILLMLRREIDDRQTLFVRHDAFTLDDLRRLAPNEAPPRIVLLLDSYGGFTAAYERVDGGELVDLLPRLIADGRAAGVHVIATADRRSAVPPAVASIVPARLVLRMAEQDEYSALGLDTRITRGANLPPGRGFLDGKEAQVALIGPDPSAEAQAASVAALARQLRVLHGDAEAPRLRQLPAVVSRDELVGVSRPWTTPAGIDEQQLETVAFSLADNHVVVAGPYNSGRSTALATIAAGLRESTPGLRCALIAPRRSPLPEQGRWDVVARTDEAIVELLQRMTDEMANPEASPMLLVIDDANELLDGPSDAVLNILVRRSRDRHVRIAAAFESAALRTGYQPWIKDMRKVGQGLLLEPNQDLDGDILGVRLPRRSSAVFPPGRGYAVSSGGLALVQTAS